MKKQLLGLVLAFAATAEAEDATDYLSFTAVGGDVKITMAKFLDKYEPPKRELETSFDRNTWTAFEPGESNVTVAVDQTVYFRRPLDKGVILSLASPDEEYAAWQFVFDTGDDETVKVKAGGNVMSLLDGTCVSKTVGVNAFACLFYDCVALTVAPALPATMLAENCYGYMLYDCDSLTVAPALPATALAKYCYYEMFYDCDSLTVAPALPATTLAEGCYEGMFKYCSSLTVAPALPATVLVEYCYAEMFCDCVALTVAPALPATTLATGCYKYMFYGCGALTVAPALPATTLAEDGYYDMFAGCESLTVAPDLPATTLATGCYKYMFYGCTKLKGISVGFSEWREDLEATYRWVSDVASEGTFRCPKELPQTFGSDHIPGGWTVMEDVFFVDIPTVEHLTASVSTNGVTIESKSYGAGLRYQVDKGATVTVTFGVDDEEAYALVGRNPVVIENIGHGVVFGTTEGYPLPQVMRVFGKWAAGEDVTASLYASGVLAIAGSGAMYDFARSDDVPWADVVDKVTTVTIEEGVTKVGANAWAGMADAVVINGEAIAKRQMIAAGFAAPAAPSGAVSGAEPERIEIVDGKVLLGVSVCTNGDVSAKTEGWEKAAIEKAEVVDGEAILTVPATAEKGFMILKSRETRVRPL